ncbi:MAG TPA: hypothetical protein QF764_07525 [Planctomycetota bacterium]|jgi:hypothetical protein|nr:hypothetical protein [Planctomycetota bacterium]
MPSTPLQKFGKLLEALGLLVILVGLSMSIGLGLEDEGLASMASEFQGLMIGGALFCLGFLLERTGGGR